MYCIFFSWNILSDGSSFSSLEQNPSSSTTIFCFTIQYLANVACCLSITLFTFRDGSWMFLRRINDLHVLSQICMPIVKFRSQIKRSNIHTSLSRNGDHIDRRKYYRSGTVNSKSFVGKVLLRIKWKFELILPCNLNFYQNFELEII